MYTKVYIFIHVCGSIEGRKGECLDPRPLKIQKIRIYVVKFWKICLGLPQTIWNTSRPPHPSPGKKLWIRECTLFISICSNVSITEPVDLHTGYLFFLQWRHLHIPHESFYCLNICFYSGIWNINETAILTHTLLNSFPRLYKYILRKKLTWNVFVVNE